MEEDEERASTRCGDVIFVLHNNSRSMEEAAAPTALGRTVPHFFLRRAMMLLLRIGVREPHDGACQSLGVMGCDRGK